MKIDTTALVRRAHSMRRLTAGTIAESWYAGLARGLQRAMHGSAFGTEAEHDTWSRLHASRDPIRRASGLGYLAGLQGQWSDPPAELMPADDALVA